MGRVLEQVLNFGGVREADKICKWQLADASVGELSERALYR